MFTMSYRRNFLKFFNVLKNFREEKKIKTVKNEEEPEAKFRFKSVIQREVILLIRRFHFSFPLLINSIFRTFV